MYRYDQAFLLQFMHIHKEKPAMLPPLDTVGLESSLAMARGEFGRHRQASGAALQGSIGLGFWPGTFDKGGATNPFGGMGNFGTAGTSKLSSEDQFAMSAGANRAAFVTGTPGMQYTTRPTTVTRTASGASLRDRTRSKQGEKRGEHNKVGGGGGNQQGHGSSFSNFQNQQQTNFIEIRIMSGNRAPAAVAATF